MKEKTFEELIEEKYAGSNMMLFSKDTLIKFMQQVREATIAECLEIASRIDDAFVYEAINKLPTKSIRIEPCNNCTY